MTRGRWIAAIGVALCLLAVGLVIVFSTTDEKRPDDTAELEVQSLQDFNHLFDEADPTEPGPWTEPSRTWTHDLGCGGEECAIAADADRVYLMTNDSGGSSRIAAYDAGSGDEVWVTEEIDHVIRMDLTGDALLVEASGEHGGGLWSLDLDEGTVSWSDPSARLLGPVGRDRSLLLVQDESDPDRTRPKVLDADGKVRWDTAGEVDGALYGIPCGDAVALSSALEGLTIVEATSGEERWRVDRSLAAKCGGQVIATGNTGSLVARRAETGEALEEVRGASLGELQFVGDRVIDSALADVASFRATDPISGRWEAERPEGIYPDAYAVGDTLVQIDTGYGRAITIALEDGTVSDPVDLGERPKLNLTTRLLITATDAEVAAFDIQTLEPRWTLALPSVEHTAASQDRLFALTDDQLLAFTE